MRRQGPAQRTRVKEAYALTNDELYGLICQAEREVISTGKTLVECAARQGFIIGVSRALDSIGRNGPEARDRLVRLIQETLRS